MCSDYLISAENFRVVNFSLKIQYVFYFILFCIFIGMIFAEIISPVFIKICSRLCYVCNNYSC
ncbi:hypothetical protein CIT292_06979 [Citrobacter youngae ATCC 29220]|uniref:Uncharacterized protein n=1 Tax=Citrobacter youngae ATCC 29220 TaxID=500640 RepID=D4B941_9ENTR|nr:hypothetical protein CIT292_06979 [Citrobacter youngae ATCC 29220]